MDKIILFYSTNHAVWAGELLTENNIDNKMTSVPRDLSSDCGYCIMFNSLTNLDVEELLSSEGVEFDKIVDSN